MISLNPVWIVYSLLNFLYSHKRHIGRENGLSVLERLIILLEDKIHTNGVVWSSRTVLNQVLNWMPHTVHVGVVLKKKGGVREVIARDFMRDWALVGGCALHWEGRKVHVKGNVWVKTDRNKPNQWRGNWPTQRREDWGIVADEEGWGRTKSLRATERKWDPKWEKRAHHSCRGAVAKQRKAWTAGVRGSYSDALIQRNDDKPERELEPPFRRRIGHFLCLS